MLSQNNDNIQETIGKNLQQQANVGQFTSTAVANHTHNGTDSPRISQANVINGVKYQTQLTEDASEIFTLRGVYNANRLVFNGFAANNADGSPATKRALLNGEVDFGTGFKFGGAGSVISVDGAGETMSFLQGASGLYMDSSSLLKTRVATATDHFAYSVDNNGNVVAGFQLLNYDGESLTIQSTVFTNFKIQGSIIIY